MPTAKSSAVTRRRPRPAREVDAFDIRGSVPQPRLREVMPARVKQRPQGFDCRRQHGAQLDALAPQLDAATRDARDVEQVVDQAQHLAHLARHHRAQAGHFLRPVLDPRTALPGLGGWRF